jgi:histidinol-phosphate/aromatic aminotransferase/cobyric acid decarboxylase-like protein
MSNETVAQLFHVHSHNPSYFSVKANTNYRGEILDFCIPVNLYFPPAELFDLIHDRLSEILRYYPDYSSTHAEHIGELTDLEPSTIVPCNGSTEIITTLCQGTKGPILTSIPTFSRWTDLPEELHLPLYTIQRLRERNFRLEVDEIVHRVRATKARTLVISNPNNPTGAWLSFEEIESLLSQLKDLDSVVVDESFIDFSDLRSAASLAANSHNLIVVKSLGKSLGWHGVRLGYAVSNPARAKHLQAQLPFWNINGLAAYVLKTVIRFKKEYEESFERVAEDRIYMTRQLETVPELTLFQSKANFLFVELLDNVSGRSLRDRLLSKYGLMVRECSNKIGCSEQYLRLAVQKREAVDCLVEALKIELADIHGKGTNATAA